MCIAKILPRKTKRLSIYTSGHQYEPFTDWMPVTGVDDVRLAWTQYAREGVFESQPAYQLAEVRPEEPDSWALVGSGRESTDGEWVRDLDLSSLSNGHFWIRFGINFKSVSPTDYGSADVGLTATYKREGMVVGALEGQEIWIEQETSDPEYRYYPVGRWHSAGGISKAKAAILVSGLEGHMDFGLAYRTAAVDTEEPGAWTAAGSATSVSTTNDQFLVSDTSVTTTDKGWIQFALRVGCNTSASEDGRCVATIAVAARS